MKTQTRYEEIILNEIRSLPPPVLPQAVKILKSLKEGVKNVSRRKTAANKVKTGFCGAWNDKRSADEIVADISAHRSGFSFPSSLSANCTMEPTSRNGLTRILPLSDNSPSA